MDREVYSVRLCAPSIITLNELCNKTVCVRRIGLMIVRMIVRT